MKAFVTVSSGQDGMLALYKTLTETDDDVYAINVQARTSFGINNIKYHDSYRVESINWLRKNCRKFVYDSVIGHKAKWSPRWVGEKDYSDISEENVNNLIRRHRLGSADDQVLNMWMLASEKWYSIAIAAQELKCDVIITGHDKIQLDRPHQWSWWCTPVDQMSFFNSINSIPLVYPLEKMGRIQIYHELPKGLKQRIAPCENYHTMASGESCGKCRKCVTRRVYEELYLTGKNTIEELDKVYYDTYINSDRIRSSTGIGMTGLERLLNI